jgi:hypothetical protein
MGASPIFPERSRRGLHFHTDSSNLGFPFPICINSCGASSFSLLRPRRYQPKQQGSSPETLIRVALVSARGAALEEQ